MPMTLTLTPQNISLRTRRIALGAIQPNPFRNLELYPFREDRITALIASYESTSMWPNLLCREIEGVIQLAGGGHHRVEAAIRKYGREHEIEVILLNVDDATMLKMMAAENMETFAADFSSSMEAVEAVVAAYAEGMITLERPPRSTSRDRLRYAPSFVQNQRPMPHGRADPNQQAVAYRNYTVGTIEKFLGTKGKSVQYALQALECIELGLMEREALAGHNLERAAALLIGIPRELSATTEARREASTNVSAALRDNRITTRQVANMPREVFNRFAARDRHRPEINIAAQALAEALLNVGVDDKRFGMPLTELGQNAEHLTPESITMLVGALDILIERFQRHRNQLAIHLAARQAGGRP